MRICMLLGAVYPPDIRVTKEARALSAAGHEVVVLSHEDPERPTRERTDGHEVVRRIVPHDYDGVETITEGARFLLTRVYANWVDAVGRLIREEGIDVLHVHDLPLVRTALRVGERHDVPVVADLHENWPEAVRKYREAEGWEGLRNPTQLVDRVTAPVARWKRIERECVGRADRVITVVEEARRHYIDDCGAVPARTHVVSNVVDLDGFDASTVDPVGYDDEFVMGYVGTMGGYHRGIDTAIRAMPAVVEHVPDARLLLVGPGRDSYLDHLRELAADLGVTEHVTFVGRVPFDAVPSYIDASDACLVPHRSNGHTETTIPHKLFQYMAMSRPVMVTDVAPLARVVRETDAGLVSPSGDAESMAAAAVELADDPERAATLGANGRRAVEDRYNWNTESRRLLECYDQIDTVPARQRSR